MPTNYLGTQRAVTRASVKIARQFGTNGRSTMKLVQLKLPVGRETSGSEQTTSIRCRDLSPPATPQYGLYGSTVAWDVVLLRTFCRMPQNSRHENKKNRMANDKD